MADFITLTSFSELQKLIADGIGESLTLDFKASPSLTRDSANVLELCKDVSAFANSAGGQIVYGVAEDKKAKTFSIDGGVTDPKITREWIDQILNSKIQPRIPVVRTSEIELGGGRAFVITVPQTQTGPHQAPDLKYYRRFELQSVPMNDYEIKDIMRRATTPDLRVVLSFAGGATHTAQFASHQELSQTFFLDCSVLNDAPTPASYAIVEVFIEDDLYTPFAVDPFTQVGAVDEPSAPKFRIYRRSISAPPSLPIFQGRCAGHP